MQRYFRCALLICFACLFVFSLAACATELPVKLKIRKAENPFSEEVDSGTEGPSFISEGGDYEPEGFVFSGRVFMVGDSTMAKYPITRAERFDLNGWGMPFEDDCFIEPIDGAQKNVNVYNYAVSGASSRSYLGTEQYEYLMKHLDEGDYLFIQFGHNDENATADGGTSAQVGRTYVNELGRNASGEYSFEWYLYEKYIRPAVQVGAIPVLCSPIARRSSDGRASVSGHLPYRAVMEELADEFEIPYLDLTYRSYYLYDNLYEEGGAAATAKLNAFADEEKTNTDNTHLSAYGAYRIALIAAEEIRTLKLTVANFLVDEVPPVEPRD